MKFAVQSFRGMAPRISPRALPDNASQRAINARLLTADLEPWKKPALLEELANAGVVRSIFPFQGLWLSYTQDVEFALGPVLDDDADPRVYITGLDAPRFTTYSLATGSAAPPYPAETRLLGVPGPDTAPTVSVTIAEPDTSNITLVNPGAENGNTSGWTTTAGTLTALENGDVPGLNAQAGTWFFGSAAVAETEAYQAIDLEALGVVAGQGLRLTWYQATGSNGSTAGMEIEFYSSGGALLSSVAADQTAPGTSNSWEQRTLTTQVPDGAVTARLVQHMVRVGGGALDAYIDTIAISSIDYTNSFDGSSFSGWTVSANRGNNDSDQHRIVQIDSAVGWPAPSFYMRCDELVAYFYRDFSTDRSPSVTLTFDYWERRTRTNGGLHVLLYGSRSGVGTSIFFSTWGGLRLYGHPDWDHIGASQQQLASPGFVIDRRYTVTITSQAVSTSQANVTITVLDTVTGTNVVDGVTATVSIDGEYVGFKGGPGDLHNVWNIDNLAVTIAAPDATDEDTPVYTSYVYTFVNEFGEESAPSDASDTVQRNDNATTIVTTPTVVPTGVSLDYGIVGKRIYRAVTGALGSIFRFVAEIPLEQDDYTDQVIDAQLGEELESTDWDVPPSDLRYILALPNGIMVGASGNRLCLSVQNRPHAWPVAYRLPTDSPITGLGNVDTTVFVGTETFVYTASGNSPDAYSMSKPVAPHACMSARGVAFVTGVGVVFPGPDGLMAVTGPTEVRNVTGPLFTRDQWQALDPSTIVGISHDDIYFFFAGTVGEIVAPGDVFWLVVPAGPNGSESFVDGSSFGHTIVSTDSQASNAAPAPFTDADFWITSTADAAAWGIETPSATVAWTPDAGLTMEGTAYFEEIPGDGVFVLGSVMPDTGDPIQLAIVDDVFPDLRRLTLQGFNQTASTASGAGSPVPLGERFHWAIDYNPDNQTFTAYINGAVAVTLTYSGTLPAATEFISMEANTSTTGEWTPGVQRGSGIRYTRNVRRYTAPFTPPTLAPTDDGDPNSNFAARGLAAYALQVGADGFGLIELGMHASAVCNDLSNDALQLVLDAYEEPEAPLLPAQSGLPDPDGRAVWEWNAGTEDMRYSWLSKLLLLRPKAWRWMRLLAEDFDDVQVQVFADGALLYQRIVTSGAAFRLPLLGVTAYRTLSFSAIGSSRVYDIQVADDIAEFD